MAFVGREKGIEGEDRKDGIAFENLTGRKKEKEIKVNHF